MVTPKQPDPMLDEEKDVPAEGEGVRYTGKLL